ncbi:hypothetical protein ACIO3S_24600 [Nocardioides sp. NPDC087217]|uniref:hypothetical protein n=1 Tax=Nocardioides sp. NPDC087217 TaxID=3364335 RepID=UPI0037FF8D93
MHLLGVLKPSDWIALTALAISIVVAVRQHLASGRANLTAEWAGGPDAIVLVNHGPGPAKTVTVRVDDLLRGGPDTIPYIGVHQTTRIDGVVQAMGLVATRAEISWRDNR